MFLIGFEIKKVRDIDEKKLYLMNMVNTPKFFINSSIIKAILLTHFNFAECYCL